MAVGHVRCFSSDLCKVVYLAFCMMLLMAASMTTQALIGPVFKTVGLVSLFVNFSGAAVSYVVSPLFLSLLGERGCMAFAACIYTAYIGVLHSGVPWVFLFASFVRGLAVGPLWVAEAVYLSKIVQRVPEKAGRYNGIFFAIEGVNSLAGNTLIGIQMYLWDVRADDLEAMSGTLWVLFAVSLVATVMFFLVRPAVSSSEETGPLVDEPGTTAPPPRPPKCEPVRRCSFCPFGLLKDKPIRYILPYCFSYGYTISIMYASIEELETDVRLIPMLFLVYGLVYQLGSVICGRLFDFRGWRPLLIIQMVVYTVAWTCLPISVITRKSPLFFFCAALFGFNEALQNSVYVNSLMRCYTDERASQAFALGGAADSLGSAVIFVPAIFFPYWGLEISCAIVTLACLIPYWRFFAGEGKDLLAPEANKLHASSEEAGLIEVADMHGEDGDVDINDHVLTRRTRSSSTTDSSDEEACLL